MNNIFNQLPNDLIMKIIKMETIRKHEKECEELLNDMIYNYDPYDYECYYPEPWVHPITGLTEEEHLVYINNFNY